MLEIMRCISLGLSLFAFGFSCYSAWFAHHVNKKLQRRNMDLFVEKVKLTEKIGEYEAEIYRLRDLLNRKD
jgi:hypothetical protein